MSLIVPTRQSKSPALPHAELRSKTDGLVLVAESCRVLTAECSREASEHLSKIQHLRRWITGVYSDAKAPLVEAKKKLEAQERELLAPLAAAETLVMREILNYQEGRARVIAAIPTSSEVLPPEPQTVVDGMQSRVTTGASVHDLERLVLSVAGRILMSREGSTAVTRRWLQRECQPSPQAALTLLAPQTPAINALARALRELLNLPGVELTTKTTLVAR